MNAIGQDIAKLVDERVKLALKQRDDKIQRLENEKKTLNRLASDLKHEIKNMKTTVTMYEKLMENPKKLLRKVEHKCVGCDIRIAGHNHNGAGMANGSEEQKLNPGFLRNVPNVKREKVNPEIPDEDGSSNNLMDTSSFKPSSYSSSSSAAAASTLKTHSNSPQQSSSSSNPILSTNSPHSNNAPPEPAKREPPEIIDLSDEDEDNNSNTFWKSNTTNINDTGEESSSSSRFPEGLAPLKKVPLPPTVSVKINDRPTNENKHSAVFTITKNPANEADDYEKIEDYEICMFCNKTDGSMRRGLKSLGTVKPTNSAVFFSASHLQRGFEYHFVVRAIDGHKREGDFSEECVFSL